MSLGNNGEVDAANRLLDEASTFVGNNKVVLLELKLMRANILLKNAQDLESLGLLQAILPEAKVDTANPDLYFNALKNLASVLLRLCRYQEAHEAAAEATTFAKANFGLEHPQILSAVRTYALACANLGRVEEAKENFEDILAIQTRVLGRDHPETQLTLKSIRHYGFAVPSG